MTEVLERTGWPVLRNLVIDVDCRTVEIDHVVLTDNWIVVLEVKTLSGFISAGRDSSDWEQSVNGRFVGMWRVPPRRKWRLE